MAIAGVASKESNCIDWYLCFELCCDCVGVEIVGVYIKQALVDVLLMCTPKAHKKIPIDS